ncbi:MAG TPA: hypothetical protein VF974_04725 [Patescibacteria group bacterium]
MTPNQALETIEKLVSIADETLTDKRNSALLNEIYRIAHSANTNHSCYHVHENWRHESKEKMIKLIDY